jgi:hypothetical protein
MPMSSAGQWGLAQVGAVMDYFGGVLALGRKSLTASIQLSIADAANGIMWFKLSGSAAARHTQASVLHIGGCYLPPEGSKVYDRPLVQDPWPLLQHHLQRLVRPSDSVVLLGDFNARTGQLPEAPDLEELRYALPGMPELADLLQQDMPPRISSDTKHKFWPNNC